MLLLKHIKGQSNPVKYLSSCISSNRISASYLFSGPCGVGRALTAKAFLSELLFPLLRDGKEGEGYAHEAEKIEKKEHPDVKWLAPEKNKAIGIEEIRAIKDLLYLKPFSSGRNAAVIEDAHMMTEPAANALLKVLEEPPVKSLLILISDKKELIPETVLSRCSEVRFGFLPEKLACEIIMKNSDADKKTAGFLARSCQGSVGTALEKLKAGVYEKRSVTEEIVANLTCRGRDVFTTWHSEDKDTLIADIDTVIGMLRDAVFMKEGISLSMLDEDLSKKKELMSICSRDSGEIYRAMERLIGLKNALKGNVNPKIVSQVLPSMISS